MHIEYATKKVEKQCCDINTTKKLFGGDADLVCSLFSRINALSSAETLFDIIVQPFFRFHKLVNKNGKNFEGYFSIDVKNKREPWRIIIEPLDEDGKSYNPCNIDRIAKLVRIVEIKEVSNHYE